MDLSLRTNFLQLSRREKDTDEMETPHNAERTHHSGVVQAQAAAREFLAATLSDVQRVDVTKVASITMGEATWEAEADVVATQCNAQDPWHRDGTPRAGSQSISCPARCFVERGGVRTRMG